MINNKKISISHYHYFLAKAIPMPTILPIAKTAPPTIAAPMRPSKDIKNNGKNKIKNSI